MAETLTRKFLRWKMHHDKRESLHYDGSISFSGKMSSS
ncbi:hypothetical protein LRHMDP2_2186 [Lacticaseibacillus rhamnosus LRHMDP2]|uniref:Uncharacterized protein n=1 Tax=Lacticaseibacillus rhamnosus LRHMDP3 TaxID=1203259 RepID=A0AB33XTJ8_LACRH|nr:hypothetical protein LRHMDP2_2186 [Lacticaseibacillus rhamnosus LRHMDP2]EKS50329.1 hypothetical protein LRHMDP3_1858 [Lacticaseibacillus rhamnosus LRHMDP3]